MKFGASCARQQRYISDPSVVRRARNLCRVCCRARRLAATARRRGCAARRRLERRARQRRPDRGGEGVAAAPHDRPQRGSRIFHPRVWLRWRDDAHCARNRSQREGRERTAGTAAELAGARGAHHRLNRLIVQGCEYKIIICERRRLKRGLFSSSSSGKGDECGASRRPHLG